MSFRKFREEMGVGFEILAESIEELKKIDLPQKIKKSIAEDLNKCRQEADIEGLTLRDHGDEYVLEIRFGIPDTRKGGIKKVNSTERRYSKK